MTRPADEAAGAVPGSGGAAPPWAGECWAVEAELTRKTVRRTAAIMAEILTRTGDYGCPAAEVRVPGSLPRHARVLYLCSAAARPTVVRARDALPGALAGRVEIRGLPASAALPGPGVREGRDMIRRYLGFLMLRGLARMIWRLLRIAVLVAALILAAPAVLVAAYAAPLAWFLGWPPRQLYRAAAWCLPMLAAWLAAMAADGRPWPQLAAAPYLAWLAAWHEAAAGSYLKAAVTVAPLAIPVGLVAGGLAWSWRIYTMETGSGGLAPSAPAAFDQRQWRHQVRTARARIAAPGSVPLLSRDGSVVAGATIRAVRHPARPLAVLPFPRLRSHQVVLGTTGTGKTTLLLRLWAGFMTRGMQLHAAGRAPRPLLVVLDCKGGADSRRIADRARRVLRGAGAASTAVWPDEASLSLWALPPRQLVSTLADMVESGTGGAAYYADVLEEIVRLAVEAPCGPPASTADFLARLDANWLGLAYAGAPDSGSAGLLRSSAGHVGDVALRYRALLRRLGTGLDGPGGFGDADAWYCILEGTAEIAVAEAQARALVDLLAWFAAGAGSASRAARPAAARRDSCWRWTIQRREPPPAVWQLYERARSLGLAVQVSPSPGRGSAADIVPGGRSPRSAPCVPPAAYLAAVRAGPFPRPGRPGVGPVLARAGRGRGRAVPGGDHRGRRHLAAAHAAPGTGRGPGRRAAGGGHGPQAPGRAVVGARGAVPGRGHAGGGPRAHPRAGRRPGRLHLPRRGDLRAGEAPGGRACGAGRPGHRRHCRRRSPVRGAGGCAPGDRAPAGLAARSRPGCPRRLPEVPRPGYRGAIRARPGRLT